MNKIRRVEHNRITNEIRSRHNYIRVNTTTIQNTKRSCQDVSFGEQQIQKLRDENIKYQSEIDELNDRLSQLSKGYLDEEIITHIEKETSISHHKRDNAIQKKQEKLHEQNLSHTYYQYNRSGDRNLFRMKKEMDRSYKYFQRTCERMPNYMLEKLKDMPNNKGYIWRDIYCYGEQPSEPNQPVIMFERQHNGVLFIHEWTDSVYRKYEKNGKARKRLVENSYRHIKRLGYKGTMYT